MFTLWSGAINITKRDDRTQCVTQSLVINLFIWGLEPFRTETVFINKVYSLKVPQNQHGRRTSLCTILQVSFGHLKKYKGNQADVETRSFDSGWKWSYSVRFVLEISAWNQQTYRPEWKYLEMGLTIFQKCRICICSGYLDLLRRYFMIIMRLSNIYRFM